MSAPPTNTSRVQADPLPPIPVTIVGGYLGAGKTTLVNHLLRHADGLRIAVLVNELGDLAIDADLIEAADADMLSVAGGCVCCSYGSDLMAALMDLASRRPRFDHVVLETSGVALPIPVAASLTLLADYTNDGIVILADSTSVRRHASDRYLSDTILQQLSAADLIVLNKADLVDAPTLEVVRTWLDEAAGGAKILTAVKAAVPRDVITGARLGSAIRPRGFDLPSHLADIYGTQVLDISRPVDAEKLAVRLAAPILGLLRAKGFVTGQDGQTWAIQVVGARHQANPANAPASNPGRIVCIGLKHELQREALHALAEPE